jgi:EamA domain-containing membrane protein RarD
LFLIGSGLITGLPLLFFSEAAKKSPITWWDFFSFLHQVYNFYVEYFCLTSHFRKQK